MIYSPSVKRKRTLNEECRVFQTKWELLYFCALVNGKIQCLICYNYIASTKEYNIKRHHETNHHLYDKYEGKARISKLEELKNCLKSQQACFTKIEKDNVSSVTASYELSRMIAIGGKSYSEGVFLKKCLVQVAQIVCPEKAYLFKDISLSRNTVAERINEMSGDIKQQMRIASAKFENYSIAIDETVDISGIAQLAIFIRACDRGFNIYEELLELVPMHDTTTSQDIFEEVEQVMSDYDLDFSKFVCLSTDGAANMVGIHNGVAAKFREKMKNSYSSVSFLHFHCIIHQQNLCSKVLKLDHVINLVTKIVNFIRSRDLNHRQFKQLLEDMESQFIDVPYHTEIRWLSCHKVLKRFYLLREEIILFLEMKGEVTENIKDIYWIQDLAFTVDITEHMNNLNLILQGRNKLISQLYDDIKCFISKLKLWISQLSNENLTHFPTCKLLKTTDFVGHELFFSKYNSNLELLLNEFQRRFHDFTSLENHFALFSAPFSFDAALAEESLQMELLDLQSDSTLKAKYLEVGIPDFFAYIPEKYENLRKFFTRYMAMFGSTYVCEQLFSFMKLTKTSQRTRLTDQHLSFLIKVGVSQAFQPDISKIVNKKRC